MNRSVSRTTAIGLLLALVLLVSINALANRLTAGVRVDLTEQGLYTLSRGTRAILGKLDEPITLKFYVSKRLAEEVPSFAIYGQRVREMLQEYAARSKGKIRLQLLDPTPFSDVEDQAVAAGLQGVPLDQVSDEQVYFGLVGSNSTDDTQVIPFFQPERERFLEFDLSKLVQNLAFPKRKVIGVATNLPLDGDQMAAMQGRPVTPQTVMDQLRQTFDVHEIGVGFDKVPADVDVLMIVQPQNLSPKTLFAIDQFVLNGGRALVFVDPYSEFQTARPTMLTPPGSPTDSDLEPLFKAWGIELVKGKVAADQATARKVNAGSSGRQQPIDYVAWLNLQSANFNRDDPVTSELGSLHFATPGVIQRLPEAPASAGGDAKPRPNIEFTPLVMTSPASELLDVAQVKGIPDVVGLLQTFKPSGERLTLAARVSGIVDSAYPDGPPVEAKPADAKSADAKSADAKPADAKPADAKSDEPPAGGWLKVAAKPINVIVVGDTDLLDDRFWVQTQDFFGQTVAVPNANNGDFVINAADSLSGSGDLIGLRSRGTAARPFELVQNIQREAEDHYRTTEKQLQDKLKATETKIADLKSKDTASGTASTGVDQVQAIETFRGELVQTRQQLRQVQLALRQNIDLLKNVLVVINVGLVPLGVAIVALIVGIVRLRRRKRRAAAL
ncbi:MAG TPA: Gldg family protein [Stellaceae bacterium]|nr:Gldg family protein [Stellaceae bacterium]